MLFEFPSKAPELMVPFPSAVNVPMRISGNSGEAAALPKPRNRNAKGPAISKLSATMFVLATTEIVNDIVAVSGGVSESVACTVKVEEPTRLGRPETTPEAGLSVRPGGKSPPTMLHVTGETPPLD